MTEVIQLERVDLAGIFAESLPTAPRLPEWQAARALRMLRAGHDAAAAAMRLQVPVAAILPIKDYLDRRARETAERETAHAAAQEELARLRREASSSQEHHHAPPQCPPEPAESSHEPDAPACVTPADPLRHQLEQSAPRSDLRGVANQPPAPADSAPDVAFNLLQRGAIRLLRKGGTTPEALARAFRTNPDQIRRVCGETEASP